MDAENPPVYKDRTPVLAFIGAVLLLVGAAAALLGPVEIYCFYLFSEGGRFHYEGFGFGTLMFASVAWQVIGYYTIYSVAGCLTCRVLSRWTSVSSAWWA